MANIALKIARHYAEGGSTHEASVEESAPATALDPQTDRPYPETDQFGMLLPTQADADTAAAQVAAWPHNIDDFAKVLANGMAPGVPRRLDALTNAYLNGTSYNDEFNHAQEDYDAAEHHMGPYLTTAADTLGAVATPLALAKHGVTMMNAAERMHYLGHMGLGALEAGLYGAATGVGGNAGDWKDKTAAGINGFATAAPMGMVSTTLKHTLGGEQELQGAADTLHDRLQAVLHGGAAHHVHAVYEKMDRTHALDAGLYQGGEKAREKAEEAKAGQTLLQRLGLAAQNKATGGAVTGRGPSGAVGQDSQATVRSTVQPMPGFDPDVDAPIDPFVLGYSTTRRAPEQHFQPNQRLRIPYKSGGPVKRRGFWDGGDTGSDESDQSGGGYDNASNAAESYGSDFSAGVENGNAGYSDWGAGTDWGGVSRDLNSIGDNYASGNYSNGDPGNWGADPSSVGVPDNSGFYSQALAQSEPQMPEDWGSNTSHELMAMNPGDYYGESYPALNDFHPTQAGAAGYLGVSNYESGVGPGDLMGLNPGAVNSIGAIGINQDLGQRKTDLLDQLGISPGLSRQALSDALSTHTLDQMAYGLNEIATNSGPKGNYHDNYAPSYDAMTDPSLSPSRVASTLTNNFERPGGPASRASMGDRQASARAYDTAMNDLTNGTYTPQVASAVMPDRVPDPVQSIGPYDFATGWSSNPPSFEYVQNANTPAMWDQGIERTPASAYQGNVDPNAFSGMQMGSMGAPQGMGTGITPERALPTADMMGYSGQNMGSLSPSHGMAWDGLDVHGPAPQSYAAEQAFQDPRMTGPSQPQYANVPTPPDRPSSFAPAPASRPDFIQPASYSAPRPTSNQAPMPSPRPADIYGLVPAKPAEIPQIVQPNTAPAVNNPAPSWGNKLGALGINAALGIGLGPLSLIGQGISYAMPGHQSLGSRMMGLGENIASGMPSFTSMGTSTPSAPRSSSTETGPYQSAYGSGDPWLTGRS